MLEADTIKHEEMKHTAGVLRWEIIRMWKMKQVVVIPVAINTLGTVSTRTET